MTPAPFLKAVIGFVIGGAVGCGLGYAAFRLWAALQRKPILTGQIGDIGLIPLLLLGLLAAAALLALLGGIVGVMLVRRYWHP